MVIFHSYINLPEGTTGWWLTYRSEKWWSSSMGRMTSHFFLENTKCSKPPTRQGVHSHWGYPSWIVYHGKSPQKNGWFRGPPAIGKPPWGVTFSWWAGGGSPTGFPWWDMEFFWCVNKENVNITSQQNENRWKQKLFTSFIKFLSFDDLKHMPRLLGK